MNFWKKPSQQPCSVITELLQLETADENEGFELVFSQRLQPEAFAFVVDNPHMRRKIGVFVHGHCVLNSEPLAQLLDSVQE